jgi:hypothetical protein
LRRGWLALGGLIFLVVGIAVGIPFDTLYRVGCAVGCFLFVAKLRCDYPSERWSHIGFLAIPLVNICLFLTPLFNRPSSRGEVILFALPDAIVLLVARLATTTATDDHQRAQRQMVIFGLVVAILSCGILYSLILIPRSH